MSDIRSVWTKPEPPPIVQRETFEHDGETLEANLHDAPGIEAEWRIAIDSADGKAAETLTIVADKIDVAVDDLTRRAELQRGYAAPFLARADEADRQRGLVASLVEQVTSKQPAVVAEPVDQPVTKVQGRPVPNDPSVSE